MGNPLTDMPKKSIDRFVRIVEETWSMISYDYLQMCENNFCTAEEARSAVADYIDNADWWNLSHEVKDAIIKKAITNNQCI